MPIIKLNSDWQIAIILRKICIMDRITSFMTLYLVNNLGFQNKHIYILAKKVGLIIKKVLIEIF